MENLFHTYLFSSERLSIVGIFNSELINRYIFLAIEVPNNNPNISKFNVGFIQT